MKRLISLDVAKTTEARSPCIPAPTITGLPGYGPRLLESVLKRRLNSQTLLSLPSAVRTVYVSPQWLIAVTCPGRGAAFRFAFDVAMFIMPPRCAGLGASPAET